MRPLESVPLDWITQETRAINPHVEEIQNYKFKISNVNRLVSIYVPNDLKSLKNNTQYLLNSSGIFSVIQKKLRYK